MPLRRAMLLDGWGFEVVDHLDVANLDQEERHGYQTLGTWRASLREFQISPTNTDLLIDGGRQTTKGERFIMACRPDTPGALILRTEAFLNFTLKLTVDGRPVGQYDIDREPLVWGEVLMEIPAEFFTSDRVEIQVELPVEGNPYSSYHYWLIQ